MNEWNVMQWLELRKSAIYLLITFFESFSCKMFAVLVGRLVGRLVGWLDEWMDKSHV